MYQWINYLTTTYAQSTSPSVLRKENEKCWNVCICFFIVVCSLLNNYLHKIVKYIKAFYFLFLSLDICDVFSR